MTTQQFAKDESVLRKGTGSFFPFFSGISAEEGNIKRVCRNQTPGQFSRTEGIRISSPDSKPPGSPARQ